MENNSSPSKLESYFFDELSSNKKEKKMNNLKNDTIRNETENSILNENILNIEQSLSLFSFPSFNTIYQNLPEEECKLLLNNLSTILFLKEKDNDKRAELLIKIAKLETDKKNYENEINKLKQNLSKIKNKLDKNEQNYVNEKKRFVESIENLKKEKEQGGISINALLGKENQYINEIKKKNTLISNQNEQIKKLSDSLSNKSKSVFSFSNSEITMSYCLNSTIDKKTSGTKSQKDLFYEGLSKNLTEKYREIRNENEKMKLFLNELNTKIVELATKKKESFYNIFRSTFGVNFENDKNINLEINSNKTDINHNCDLFIEQMKVTFLQFQEFLIRTDELLLNSSSIITKETIDNSTQNDSTNSNSNSKKYYKNMIFLFTYYQYIANELSDMLNYTLRNNKLDKEQKEGENMIERALELIQIGKENIAKCLEENKQIEKNEIIINSLKTKDNDIIMKSNSNIVLQNNYLNGNINYEALENELNNYSNILSNMVNYIDEKGNENEIIQKENIK